MKTLFRYFAVLVLGFQFISCDRIEKPYLPAVSSELNQSLFPGDWEDYPWPTFGTSGSVDRNVLLEDYTGHKCIYCPAAAVVAEKLEADNPNRVFVASIHTSPGGMGPFQTTDNNYPINLTNQQGLEYGSFFSTGFGFDANPKGTVNRKEFNGFIFQSPNSWTNYVGQILTENTVSVDLQAKVNYFSSTRGLFLHVLLDTKNVNPDEVTVVNYLLENQFISKQKYPGGVEDENYKHHNVHRGSVDGQSFGRNLDSGMKNSDDKYELNYSYKLPDNFDPTNMHILVYVRHKVTQEILQVVKVNLQ